MKAICTILLLLLVSCGTERIVTREVPIEKVKEVYVHDLKIDSVFIHDTVDRYVRNDTVFIYKEKVKYKLTLRVDTVTVTDSIPKIITVENSVVKEVNVIKDWQKLLMFGGAVFYIFLAYIIYKKFRDYGRIQ